MYQETTIVGTVGKDPVLKTVNGKQAATFSVATNRYLGNGLQPETTWFSVTVWEKTAETVCRMAQKGTKIFCKGRLVCDSVTGCPRVFQRSDGTYGSAFEMVANTVKMISNYKADAQQNVQQQPQQNQQQPAQAQAQAQQPQMNFADFDDIPF